MFKEYYKTINSINFVFEILILNASFTVSYFIRFRSVDYFYIGNAYLILQLLSNIFWFVSAVVSKVYRVDMFFRLVVIKNVAKTYVYFLFLYFGYITVTKSFFYSRLFHIYFLSLSGVLQVLLKILSIFLLRNFVRMGSFKKNVVIVGDVKNKDYFIDKIRNYGDSLYNVVGYIGNRSDIGLNYLGRIEDCGSIVRQLTNSCKGKKSCNIDEILITSPINDEHILEEIINVAERNFIKVKLIPEIHPRFQIKPSTVHYLDGLPVISFRDERIDYLHNRIIKRSFDVIFSSLVIIGILSWLTPLLWILYKIFLPGPLFFTQERIGKNNKTFKCFKFRTVKKEHCNHDYKPVSNGKEERINCFGRLLRKTNIDELPQFINVFLGHMSIVGPRAHAISFQEKYREFVDNISVRQLVKPGITGWAQVNGYRGDLPDEEENKKWIKKRIEHDIWYIENWSFLLDLKIIGKTVLQMITFRVPNAY